MNSFVVVIPDYEGTQNLVYGMFPDEDAALAWGRTNVGGQRAWFAAPIEAIQEYRNG